MKYIKDFERSTALLVEMFCKKHETSLVHIVADQICGLYCIGDNYFTLDDIYFDMSTDQPKMEIFEWQWACIDAHFEGITEEINYRSWCMGARFEDIKKF